MRRVFGVSALLVLLATARLMGQGNRCVECHFAHLSEVPAPQLLADWSRSAHGRHDVACNACHGGDATTYSSIEAHRGTLAARHPLSSVNRTKLPLTCAGCHEGVVSAFRTSVHEAVDDPDSVPTCTTCHGRMAGERPSPVRFESGCRGCHQPADPHADYGSLARAKLESLVALDETLSRLERSIAGLDDRSRRNRLAAELLLARASVRAARESLHTCDFHRIDQERARAQRRASELIAALLGAE